MRFPSSADVIVVAINRRGRVIDVRGDVYRVLVGALTMTCREHELRAVGRRQTGEAPRNDTRDRTAEQRVDDAPAPQRAARRRAPSTCTA